MILDRRNAAILPLTSARIDKSCVTALLYYPMYIDLNVPAPQVHSQQSHSKKGKGKQNAPPPKVNFAPAQLAALENRIDLLVHCQSSMYSVEIF